VTPWLSHTRARRRWEAALLEHGPEHPATQAALGRLAAALDEPVPQIYAPVLRAYLRALGDRGYMNRAARRALVRQLSAVQAC
jgi:hypothetical protein